ncbi:MAG: extracellular solute-binding protein [Pseudodonghicola sp.]
MKLNHALAVAALTGAVASGAEAEGRITFDFWHAMTGQVGEVVQRQCDLFNQSQGEYEAVCTSQGGYDLAEQNTIAAYRSKQQPTLVQLYEVGTVNFMLSGAVYPATQFAADHGMTVDWAGYFPGIANYYADSKGDMWSFPYNSSTPVLYWNRDAWAKIGKDHAPATWAELGADLAALQAAGVDCGFAFDFDAWMNLEQFSATNNLPVASLDNGFGGLAAEVVFDKTAFVDHMQDYKDWVDAGYARIQTTQTGKTLAQSFADGTCASMVHTIGQHAVIKSTQAEGLNWDVALMPVIEADKRHNSIVGGASIWVMKGKSEPEYEAAAAFLSYITAPDTGERYIAENTGYIPVTTAGYRLLVSEGFYQQAANKGREIAIESLSIPGGTALTRGIRLGNHISIRNALRSELEAAFGGQKDVAAAIADAAAESNDMLRRFEKTYRGADLP